MRKKNPKPYLLQYRVSGVWYPLMSFASRKEAIHHAENHSIACKQGYQITKLN